MKAPIIIDEHGTPMIFGSKQDAELYLEAVDVQNDEYVGYDSEGRLLHLVPLPPHSVLIKDGEPYPTHTKELRAVLVNLLSYVGLSDDWLSEASLEQLVEKAAEYKIDLNQGPLDGVRNFFKRFTRRK